jgi:hypothetical protein
MDEEMKKYLPPTDCRRRPDQRFMEEGNYDTAANEKHRLEQKQRAARKIKEENQIPYKPLWFVECDDEIGDEKTYKFGGKYWEHRKRLDWSECPDLF